MTCPQCAKHEARIAVLTDEPHRASEAARKLGVERSAVWAWIAAHAAVRHAETAPMLRQPSGTE